VHSKAPVRKEGREIQGRQFGAGGRERGNADKGFTFRTDELLGSWLH